MDPAIISNCIFCGKPETSKEHAFPNWLRKRYKGKGTIEYQRSLHEITRTTRGEYLTVVVKCVCEKCNCGWMKDHQDRAKPVIERLLDNPRCELSIYDFKTLSLWSVMSMMVLEATNEPDTWRFTVEDRCLFQLKDKIPLRTSIWIAKWVASPGPFYSSHMFSAKDSRDRATVATFGFGTLAFQIQKVVPQDQNNEIPMATRQDGHPWEQILLPIWQPQAFSANWPPSMGIQGEAGFDELDLRFSTGSDQ